MILLCDLCGVPVVVCVRVVIPSASRETSAGGAAMHGAAHGGRVWAENAPGGGAMFTFTLRAE